MPVSTASNSPRPSWVPGRFLLVSSCLGATLLASTLIDRRKPDALAQPLEIIDSEITDWKISETQSLPQSLLEVLQPSNYVSRTYAKQDRRLGLFIAYYAQQRAGESMHSPKVCLPGSGWAIVQQGTTFIPVGGTNLKINQYHIQRSGARMLVLYWYQSRNRVIASEYLGKVFLFKDAILGGYTSGSIVRIILPDDSLAAADGVSFARALIPQIQRCFSGTPELANLGLFTPGSLSFGLVRRNRWWIPAPAGCQVSEAQVSDWVRPSRTIFS
jgi:EpsI family protein